ncbi:hypothetical protein COK05_08300 [Bacillus cereus]|uniref:Uncharacterized protein n=1 Tax=Bacillus cereus TaxID=1396 RepID=A0A2B2LZP3_BACCE|nr:hypothetical protein COK05_08300 [Bacillus cereus]PGU10849.1 hypothetical protein COD21_13750 [Bacillus cereus]
MSNFKYYRRNLKLHYVEFEILLVVFEVRVKIKKVTPLKSHLFLKKQIMHQILELDHLNY